MTIFIAMKSAATEYVRRQLDLQPWEKGWKRVYAPAIVGPVEDGVQEEVEALVAHYLSNWEGSGKPMGPATACAVLACFPDDCLPALAKSARMTCEDRSMMGEICHCAVMVIQSAVLMDLNIGGGA